MSKPPHTPAEDSQDSSSIPLETMEDRVKAVHQLVIDKGLHVGPDAVLLKDARLLSVSHGKTSWEIDIEPHHCNMTGNLHGGAAATILDNLSSSAYTTLAEPGTLGPGTVSRTIIMTYLRPVPLGSKAQIECKLIAAGKSLINVYGEILVGGKVCVTCVHDKAILRDSKL